METDILPPAAAAPSAPYCAPPSSSSSLSSSSSSSPSSSSSSCASATAGGRGGVRTPGERLGSTSTFSAGGRGTYERNGYIYAATVGIERLESLAAASEELSSFSSAAASPADTGAQRLPMISIVPLRQSQGALPTVGSTVLALVTKVSLLRAECSIIVIEHQAVSEPFKGIVRAQDVRETDVDSVDMFDCYQPGDILRARVISVADPRCYLLSTAAVHLGVLYAQGKEGAQLRPVTRRLLRCDLTGKLYRRKVAVPLLAQEKSS